MGMQLKLATLSCLVWEPPRLDESAGDAGDIG